jgi:hypothetical protein
MVNWEDARRSQVEASPAHCLLKFGANASYASCVSQTVTVKNASPSPTPAWNRRPSGVGTGGSSLALQLSLYCSAVIEGGLYTTAIGKETSSRDFTTIICCSIGCCMICSRNRTHQLLYADDQFPNTKPMVAHVAFWIASADSSPMPEGSRRVLHEQHMEMAYRRFPGRRLATDVGRNARHHDRIDPARTQQEFKISTMKSTESRLF